MQINEHIEDLEIDEPSAFKFHLEKYEGPLFLLLDLVREKKVAIQDIRLADITEQYLQHIKQMEFVDMETSSQFLALATILIEIKSRSLLPHEEDENYLPQEDPEVILKKQLELLSLFQDVGLKLSQKENVNRLYKDPDKSSLDVKIVFNEFNYDALLDAFAIILARSHDKDNPIQTKSIEKDKWTVAEKIAQIKSLLSEQKEILFFDLFEEGGTKMEIITIFLALLELLKFQQVYVKQKQRYADIKIVAKENIKHEIE